MERLRPHHDVFLAAPRLLAVGEWLDRQGPQDQFEWWTARLGLPDWAREPPILVDVGRDS